MTRSIQVGDWVVVKQDHWSLSRDVSEVTSIETMGAAQEDRITVRYLSDDQQRTYSRNDLELAATQP